MALRLVRFAFGRPLGRLLSVLVLLSGAAFWYVATHGGWATALRLPPTLDAATPRDQNGWSLLNVQMPGPRQGRYGQAFAGFEFKGADFQRGYEPDAVDTADAFGLWLAPPPGDSVTDPRYGSASSQTNTSYSASARLSTGDTFPLEWHAPDRSQGWPPGEAARDLMLVTLPSGYSDACRFVDITVADKNGHAARWRLTDLPRMRHAVPPPAAPVTTVTRDGITMSAQAWHQLSVAPNGSIEYLLRPVLPPNSHQWDVRMTDRAREWEPFDAGGRVEDSGTSAPVVLGRNGVFDSAFEARYGGGINQYACSDPYPRMSRFLRLTTTLRQFETYDEPVTFHNLAVRGRGAKDAHSYYFKLPQPLSVTTPSGVTVTLPAQNGEGPTGSGYAMNLLVNIIPQFESTPTAHALPNSPLAKAYGKPVLISLTIPPPYHLSGCYYQQNNMPADYALSLPHDPANYGKLLAPPPVLKNLTIIVRQRVDLRAIPMTFTLPIADQPPPLYPKG